MKKGTASQTLTERQGTTNIMPPPALPELYKIEEVARLFKKNQQTIRRWIHSKKIVANRIGRSYYISRQQIDKLVK